MQARKKHNLHECRCAVCDRLVAFSFDSNTGGKVFYCEHCIYCMSHVAEKLGVDTMPTWADIKAFKRWNVKRAPTVVPDGNYPESRDWKLIADMLSWHLEREDIS